MSNIIQTSLPTFALSINQDIRSAILDELKQIETEHEVTILFAVESGSRAWGFPSPDSDYDVRFVYAHKTDWYLSIFEGRDVIERPINDDLDISGWDIKKALELMLKPNPVLYEWLSSPIRYIWRDKECEKLTSFSRKPAHSTACLYHYLNLGRRQFDLHMGREDRIKLKKYFYVLRPALAIRWMRLHPDILPPMNIQDLVKALEMQPSIVKIIGDLIQKKATLDEAEDFRRISELDHFIREEFEWAEQTEKKKVKQDLASEADSLFRDILHMVKPA